MIEFLCNQRECNDLSCISRKRIFTAAPLSHPSGSNKLSSPLVATLTNFSSSGTESSAMKVKLQWQMPMNCSSFLRGATPRGFFTLGRWIHSHQEKEISPAGCLVHFRFSPSPIFLFALRQTGLKKKRASVGDRLECSTHSVGGGCFWGTPRERSQNEQESSSPRARYLGQLNQALATY